MLYSFLKLIHIGSLIFWIGPALGAWLVLKYSIKENGDFTPFTRQVYKIFLRTLTIEHIAFVFLLGSGFTMALIYGWWEMLWLRHKLILVILIVIPLEIVDIYLGNYLLNKIVSKSVESGLMPGGTDRKIVNFYHETFTKIALFVLPLTVFLIMFLAISKQTVI